MQYENIKDELPTYVIAGHVRENGSIKPDLFTTLIKCDRAHIESLVSGNSTWQSITIFEIPKDPIIDMDQNSLLKFRNTLQEQTRKKSRYEMYLRLKKEFEPEII